MVKNNKEIEYRYYDMKENEYAFALQGNSWIRVYGIDNEGKRIENLHFHNYLEIGYCIFGEGEMILDEKKCPYKSGDFTIIPSGFPHTTNSEGNSLSYFEYIFIDIEKLIKRFYNEAFNMKKVEKILSSVSKKAIILNEKDNIILSDKIKIILDLYRQKEEFYEEEVYLNVVQLLLEIVKFNNSKEDKTSVKIRHVDKEDSDVITDVIEFINKNYKSDIKVSDLAEKFFISETHLRRLFEKKLDMPVLKYINLVRISKACEMLSNTKLSIDYIAIESGYKINSTFNRNFTKIMNQSPKDYRKNMKSFKKDYFSYNIKKKVGWK